MAPNEIPPGPHRYFGYGLGQTAAGMDPSICNPDFVGPLSLAEQQYCSQLKAGAQAPSWNMPDWMQYLSPPLHPDMAPSVFTGATPQPTPAATAPTPEERRALLKQQLSTVPTSPGAAKSKAGWITPTVIVAGGVAIAAAVWYLFLREKETF